MGGLPHGTPAGDEQQGEEHPHRRHHEQDLVPPTLVGQHEVLRQTATTSVTPSTRSRRIRSIPAFMVCVEMGHVPQAPTSSTVTLPASSSTSLSTMSPPSAWSAGRITSMVSSTRSLMGAIVAAGGPGHNNGPPCPRYRPR